MSETDRRRQAASVALHELAAAERAHIADLSDAVAEDRYDNAFGAALTAVEELDADLLARLLVSAYEGEFDDLAEYISIERGLDELLRMEGLARKGSTP